MLNRTKTHVRREKPSKKSTNGRWCPFCANLRLKRHRFEGVFQCPLYFDLSDKKLLTCETVRLSVNPRIKLSASNYVDGKDKLSQMQSDFAVEVGNKHGLTRGILGSKAKHQTVKSFYGDLAQSQKNHGRITAELLTPRKTKRSILGFSERETPEQVAERISTMMKKHYAHSIQLAALSRTEKLRAEALTLSAREKDEQIQLLQKKLVDETEELEKITGGLTDDQYQEVRKMAFLFRQENDEKKISEEDTEYRNNSNNGCTL